MPATSSMLFAAHGNEFTDNLFSLHRRQPTENHKVDTLCCYSGSALQLTERTALTNTGGLSASNDS
ncbi:MAG: hypothetical protein DWI68_04800 [Chloroflexi bacterium]|nr:MAG: hypothetical protein DWI68_04800 [Chloroflexota bacterium]